jgi:hypothetical protein
MKFLYAPTLLFSFILLFTLNANAQTEDYVITTKGDTLKCSISFPLIGASKYTLAGGGAKKFDRDEIKEYYITRKDLRKRAVFKEDKTKAEYMTVIENGPISLYEVIYTHYNQFGGSYSTTDWYVSKNSERVTGLKTSSLFIGKSKKIVKTILPKC